MAKSTKPITRKLFIEELERPAPADAIYSGYPGGPTTLAVGEESIKGK